MFVRSGKYVACNFNSHTKTEGLLGSQQSCIL